MLFFGDYITMFKDKITLKSKDAYLDNMLTLVGMECCAANGDKEMLESSEAEMRAS